MDLRYEFGVCNPKRVKYLMQNLNILRIFLMALALTTNLYPKTRMLGYDTIIKIILTIKINLRV